MSKRKQTCILFFIGSYVLTVFCLSLHFIHKSYTNGFNETDVVFVHNNNYKVVQHKPRIRWCQPMRYITNTTGRPVIALVSFPGSGNTWLRYLLQQATGILTGSIYKDYGLLWNGLYGESITNATVSVVKTHEWGPEPQDFFDKAILLVRFPSAAIQASSTEEAEDTWVTHPLNVSLEMRVAFVTDKLKVWRKLNLDWIHNYNKPLLVVYYDDLVYDTKKVMESIITFLGFTINRNHLRCMMRRKEGIYHRRKPYLPFNPFTPELRTVLQAQWKEVDGAIKWRCKVRNQYR